MNSRGKLALLATVGVPLLFVALIVLQARIDASAAAEVQGQAELLLSSGTVLKRLSLGYDALLADIYWTRAVQYYGSNAGIPGVKFPLLWPLLDITTTLDPKLTPAYRFGAVFLSEQSPVGKPARLADERHGRVSLLLVFARIPEIVRSVSRWQ
jgi:hypothetical protein